LASVSKDFEEIELIKCTKQSNIFECEVSVTEPTKIVEFIKLCPVIYEDTMLKLGENMVLAKEMSTNKLKFLSCSPNSLSSAMPDCIISDQQQNCLNNLQIDDIDAITVL
jgi:midasin (ATPase involved in ribosome maturation)